MKLGVSSSVFLYYELEEALQRIGDLGFSHVELWGEPPHLWAREYGAQALENLANRLTQNGLRATYHAPAHDVDLASMNPGIWRESVNQHLEALEVAARLNASPMVLHGGSYYPGDKPGQETGKDRLYRGLEILLPRAEELGIRLAVENCPLGAETILHLHTFQDLLSTFSSSHLGITLDIGHAHIQGEEIRKYFSLLEEHIFHIHISDNDGQADLHQIPGQGTLDFPRFMKALAKSGFDGISILEIWAPQGPEEALEKARDYLLSFEENRP